MVKMRHHMPNFAAIGQTLWRYGDFSVFQDGGHPPSWICYAGVWITHEG